MWDLVVHMQFFPDQLQNPVYLGLLKHEVIHIKLHYLCRKNINPTITSETFVRKDMEWFRCRCDLAFDYKRITIGIFFRLLFSSIMSMFYDIIFYITNGTCYIIKETIVEHFSVVLSYLLGMWKDEKKI